MKLAKHASAANKVRALFSRGMASHESGDLLQAQALYRQVLGLMPSQPDALHMLGVTEFQNRRYDEAVRLIDKASQLQPSNDLVHFNLGNALRAAGHLERATEAFTKAARLRPDHLAALKNLGNVLKEQNRLPEAIACYDQLLAKDPAHVHTLYNKAIALLTQGELGAGWDLYDYRLQCDTPDHARIGHALPNQAPAWAGEPLAKPLLVLPEQGLGDQIFYGAMLADLETVGVGTCACFDGRLLPLFRRSFPDIAFALPSEIGGIDPAQQLFSAQVHIGSLGKFFRRDRDALASVRAPYLIADAAQAAQLRHRLQQQGGLVCGLSWASKNADTGATKSLPLAGLLPVLQVPGVSFVDLQYGDTRQEREALAAQAGISVRRFDDIDNKNDIDGLAALITACDLVITVSNSTAHLAAALGKPVLVLLAHHTPLWYWHLDGEQSPWYPSAILLRQPAPADWNSTVERAAWMLSHLAQPA